MSTSPYAPALPYGEWVLSVAVLLGGFFWVRAEEMATRDSGHQAGPRTTSEEGGEGGEEEQQQERGEDGTWGRRTSSSAYQTDQEVQYGSSRLTCAAIILQGAPRGGGVASRPVRIRGR